MKQPVKKLLLLTVSIIFIIIIAINLDIKELIRTIGSYDIKYTLLLVISIILSLSCRAVCFKQLISNSVNAPLKDLIPLCITGAALNIVLPARAGDIFRAVYTGGKYNTGKIKMLGTVMLERIFDGLIILFILFMAIIFFNGNQTAARLCYLGAGLFVIALVIAVSAFKFNKTDAVCSFLIDKSEKIKLSAAEGIKSSVKFVQNLCNSFISGFDVFSNPSKLITVFISAFGIWFFECLNYYIIIQGFHCHVSASVVMFIIPFIALACMIPSASIFIGPYQLAVIMAFSIYNINKETALAVSITEQAIVTVTCSLIAVGFFIKNNISYFNIKKNIEENNQD